MLCQKISRLRTTSVIVSTTAWSTAGKGHCSRILTSETVPAFELIRNVLISNGWNSPDHCVFANPRSSFAVVCLPVVSYIRTIRSSPSSASLIADTTTSGESTERKEFDCGRVPGGFPGKQPAAENAVPLPGAQCPPPAMFRREAQESCERFAVPGPAIGSRRLGSIFCGMWFA